MAVRSVIDKVLDRSAELLLLRDTLEKYNAEATIRDLHRKKQETIMTPEEREYRSHLANNLQQATGEMKRQLECELEKLDRVGWNERIVCTGCGNNIPPARLKRILRTTICDDCHNHQHPHLPYADRVMVVPART